MSELRHIHIYSDESRHRGERFMLLSGLWIPKENVPVVEKMISDVREKYGYIDDKGKKIPFLGEFKWSKSSTVKYLPVYKEIIDVFFQALDNHLIRCCVMCIDTHDQAVREHDNVKGDGFYKFLYQLYYHNCKIPARYWIYPDRITNPTHNANLKELTRVLDVSLQKKFADKINPLKFNENIVEEIKPIDSKSTDLLQLVDVIMGGVGYYQNDLYEKEGASESKKELMKYLMDKIIYSKALKFDGKNYIIVKSTRFNIWLFKPKQK